MQKENSKIDDLMIRLLIHPQYKIIRHLLLLVMVFFISIGAIEGMGEHYFMTLLQKICGLSILMGAFLLGSYLNIYILTPRLLLRNKWFLYFCSLFGVAILVLISYLIFQLVIIDIDIPSQSTQRHLTVIINMLSTSIAFFLLFAGTTTVVLFSYWIQDMQQAEELEATTMRMELELLENQINPHFLFNMLNNANIMIKKDSDVAVHIIAKLEDMLRYQIDESLQEKVYLKEEVLFLNDFLDLEKTRRDDFNYRITTDGKMDDIQIPPLLFITFVENAIKHNTDSRAASYVFIHFEIKENKLTFLCENSVPKQPMVRQNGGIGLVNIRRRLDLLYKNNYSLELSKDETKYTVKLELKL